VLVAASTECFPDLSLSEALSRMVDLEYSNCEIAIHEHGGHLRPSQVAGDLPAAIETCRNTRRLDVVAYSVQIEAAGDAYYDQFAAVCRLAKATKVVQLSVPSGDLDTAFNEEVERLRRLVAIATEEGQRVSIKTQTGCLSEDPDKVVTMCEYVKGLGVTLDPSTFIYGPGAAQDYDPLIKYTYHVHLRDTSKDAFQVRIGQGSVEYNKLIHQLAAVSYNRVLSVHMAPLEGVDHMAEMRKMRLLLESML